MLSAFGAYPGAAYAVAAAVLFGASTPLAKLLLHDGLDPQLLAGLFYLGSGTGLGLIFLGRRALGVEPREARLRRQDLPQFSLAILLGGAVAPVLMMAGLARTSAAAAALLQNLEGLATMGIAWVVFRENVDRRLLAGALAILAGAVLLSWTGGSVGSGSGTGALLIAAACAAWGADNNLTRPLAKADPVQIAAVKGLVAGSANVVLALIVQAHSASPPLAHVHLAQASVAHATVRQTPLAPAVLGAARLPSVETVLLAAAVGFLAYGVSLVLYVLGLRHLGAARTAAYFSTAPFVGSALAVGLLSEPLTGQLGIAAALMAVGLYLHLSERHVHLHHHEALEHAHRHVHDEHHQHAHGPSDPPGEPHSHWHRHEPLTHSHPHYPDLHHRHDHS